MTIAITRRALQRGLAVLGLYATALVGAQTQDWPNRPVKMIVASAPATGGDVVARLMATELSKALGQQFVVENRPGALGVLANSAGAQATPDGYTVLFSFAAAIAVNHTLQPKLPYDTFKDLIPVAQVGSVSNLLLVSPDLPVKNVKEFVQYAKANPGVRYGSWGIGSGGHLAMESLGLQTGTTLVNVPYKATTAAFADVIGGHLHVTTSDSASPRTLIGAGKLRPIAAIGSRRVPSFPDVPTMTEQGFPFEADGWYGFFFPARTPAHIQQRLNEQVTRIVSLPAVREQLHAGNIMDPPPKTPAAFGDMIRRDIGIWGDVIRKAKVSLE